LRRQWPAASNRSTAESAGTRAHSRPPRLSIASQVALARVVLARAALERNDTDAAVRELDAIGSDFEQPSSCVFGSMRRYSRWSGNAEARGDKARDIHAIHRRAHDATGISGALATGIQPAYADGLQRFRVAKNSNGRAGPGLDADENGFARDESPHLAFKIVRSTAKAIGNSQATAVEHFRDVSGGETGDIARLRERARGAPRQEIVEPYCRSTQATASGAVRLSLDGVLQLDTSVHAGKASALDVARFDGNDETGVRIWRVALG
jgi:hypothetical protein